jgi:uncharacterized protein (DUF2384 family)
MLGKDGAVEQALAIYSMFRYLIVLMNEVLLNKRQYPSEDAVLTTAVTQVAQFWALTNEQLGSILGLSAATASRLRGGRYQLRPSEKAFELGQYLVRLFRGLDALLGSDDMTARAWLRTPNLDLHARPIDLVASIHGLMQVVDYVDDFRART